MKFGTTARARAESIVFLLDAYLRECARPTTPFARDTTRGFLVLAFEIALEEAGTERMANSLRVALAAAPDATPDLAKDAERQVETD